MARSTRSDTATTSKRFLELRQGVISAPRSLIISPNLDALLEHDERIRRGASGSWSPGSPMSDSPQPGSAFPVGLPPPPRGLRKPRSPAAGAKPTFPHSIGPSVTDTLAQTPHSTPPPSSPVASGSSLTPNPYINPAPSLEEVFPGDLMVHATPPPQASSVTLDALPRNREDIGFDGDFYPSNAIHSIEERPRDDPTMMPLGSPADTRRPQNEDPKRPSLPQQSKYPSLPRVDKLLNRGKSAFCISDPTSSVKTVRDEQQAFTASHGRGEAPQKISREHTRSTGKLIKSKDTSILAAEMYQSTELPIVNIQRQRSRDGNEIRKEGVGNNRAGSSTPRPPRSQRPLFLSHAHHSSLSSTASGSQYSTYSDSTRPASTIDEPRISISSTIYPSSYSHSHSHHSPTNTAPITPPDRMSSLSHLSNRISARSVDADADSDHESFIDFLSPSPQTTTFQASSRDASYPHNSRHLMPATSRAATRITGYPDEPNVPHDPNFVTSSRGRTPSPKPPIPTTPKPTFNRSTPSLGISTRASPRTSPTPPAISDYDALPPTTNFLNASERADLIRKSRKLAKVFGQTPGAAAISQLQHESGRLTHLGIPVPNPGKQRHQRGAASVSTDVQTSVNRQKPIPTWPPAEATLYISTSGRRHSTPLSPDQVSFLSDLTSEEATSLQSRPDQDIEIGTQEGVPSSDWPGRHTSARNSPDSPTSFIDLSDGEPADDGASAIIATPKKAGRRRVPSTRSLFENMTPEEQAEEERRRKREKLAKLHRFLGSRVPTNLVLGLEDPSALLPPPIAFDNNMCIPSGDDEATRKAWLKRRRSSSAAAFPSTWSDDLDRLKEDLNDKEKAINVRRALKMEKVFGVAPPQTLYHTRHSPSPSVPVVGGRKPSSSPAIGQNSSSEQPSSSTYRNFNQSAYTKGKSKDDRPGTSESSKLLLPTKGSSFDDDVSPIHSSSSWTQKIVYTHYQHSLNSLNDIIDRDDKESLAELHEYLQSGELLPSPHLQSPPLQEFVRVSERRMSTASIKSERRRSLPARTSMLSIASEYSISSPKPEMTDFQLRRRRAAKLTQFFGVDYRDLIKDVLESIEKGLEDERKRGTLNPDEVEDLLQKLRTLRTKRGGIY